MDEMHVDAGRVIDALKEQVADLSWRLAVAQAIADQLRAEKGSEETDR